MSTARRSTPAVGNGGNPDVSDSQMRALRIIKECEPVMARTVARRMWPDSPGWKVRGHRHDGKSGAAGAALWLKAGAMLSRLQKMRLAAHDFDSHQWHLTDTGRAILDAETSDE